MNEELAHLINMLIDCEQVWGCECPYCDRDFGKEFDSHSEDCEIGKLLRSIKGA